MNYLKLLKLFLLLSIFIFGPILAIVYDPYKILGIDKKATLQDIRRSYKQLAKEW